MNSKRQLDQLRLLRRRLGSFLEESLVAGQLGETSVESPGAWVPSADVLETAADFQVRAELPGVLRQDLDLRLQGARLELQGVRRSPGDAGVFHRLEGRYGRFHRVVQLNGDVDDDGVEASLDGGVLFVRIPKKRPGLGRREIPVGWEADGA
ncbi:MAG: Hsp20/alpha crystallin family protein [Acidobacteriota bacterium]|nr:Hsp20/alpha crystallin family protein [Acidobacteriota bacterium]